MPSHICRHFRTLRCSAHPYTPGSTTSGDIVLFWVLALLSFHLFCVIALFAIVAVETGAAGRAWRHTGTALAARKAAQA